jgi:hypothetical protein
MQKMLSASIVSLAVLLSSTAYAQVEIWGDFSVKGIEYTYDGQTGYGDKPTPRCSCDIDDLVFECPVPWFLSSVDQGPTCYDHWSIASVVFVRSGPGKGFEVKNGNARFPNPNTGIILTSPGGTKCFLITVDENGALKSSQTACP